MPAPPGLSGTLFPGRFLDHGIETTITAPPPALASRLRRWWTVLEADCGPASGLRALFDVAAMPLFGMLGFRAFDASFEARTATAWMTGDGSRARVALVVRPWARRPAHGLRDIARAARELHADWCFVLAPPYLSLVDARGHATWRSLDLTFPDALEPRSLARVWTLCGAGAFTREAAGGGAWIDRAVRAAANWQDRVRDDLQLGVVHALDALAGVMRDVTVRRGARAADRDEALTLVYRILFLLFAESRALVPCAHPVYGPAYSVATLCREALAAGEARGWWDALAAVTRLSRTGCESADLIVRPFNGRLFARASAPSLEPRRPARRPTRLTDRRDAALRDALVSLGSRPGARGREAIDYADLGVEQLGAVYERLLDDGPSRDRRKETGTFYTPRPLAEFVVRRTLAPLVARGSADDILALRVVDPAMGSGAFLVAACRYLADAYEQALIDEGRASGDDLNDAARADIRRLVAERCLYGVDANPVAVQLAQLSLWLATLARGKPLTFLDHRLRVGNSLIGVSPDDLTRLPSATRPASEPLPLFEAGELETMMGRMCRPLADLCERRDDTVLDVRAKEAMWKRLAGDRSPVATWRTAASLWCARWFWPASPVPSPAEFGAAIDGALGRSATLPDQVRAAWTSEARGIAVSQRFFHWPLEFPDVFYDPGGAVREHAGFDAVIGNPPWEMVRGVRGDDADAGPRRRLVRFVRESGLYASCGRGHLNLYQPFVERALSLARSGGRYGLLVPWGLAGDDGTHALRRTLLDRGGLDTIVGFDNASGLFPIHRGLRFVAIAGTNGASGATVHARFGVRAEREIEDLPAREHVDGPSAYPVRWTPHAIATLGGPALRIPDARDARLVRLLDRVAREYPALGSAAGWGVEFGRDLNATDDRGCFGREGLPVIEGKHLFAFHAETNQAAWRIRADAALARFPDRRFERTRLAYRDVSAVSNRRTLIAAMIPARVLTTHTIFCARTPLDPARAHALCGILNSFVLDAIVRMLMGGHLTTSLVEGLPIGPWRGDAQDRRIAQLSAKLAAPHGARADAAAARIAAALQAAVARRYGLSADEFDAVLDAFPLVELAEKDRSRRAFRALALRPRATRRG